MGKREAELAARKSMMAGYYHHSYEMEKHSLRYFLEGDAPLQEEFVTLEGYSDVLAPEKLRAMKNSVIGSITLLCRAVAEYGVDMEFSFSLSDYYINEVERMADIPALTKLSAQIFQHFKDLVQQEREREFSLPVVRSIRYIKQHIYERCRAADVAKALGLHQSYLSALFKQQVGVGMAQFIRAQKLDEARYLLLYSRYPVAEIADMLGYGSLSYFSTDFKKMYGESPGQFIRGSRGMGESRRA